MWEFEPQITLDWGWEQESVIKGLQPGGNVVRISVKIINPHVVKTELE